MARAPKLGRTYTRRPIFFSRPRARLKLPGKAPPVVSFLSPSGAPAKTSRISDRLLGWVMSLLVHVLALFVFVLAIRLLTKIPPAPPLPLIMPQSFLSGNQLTHADKLQTAPTRATTLKHFLNTHNSSNSVSPSALNTMLNGTASNSHLFAISLGQGGQLAVNNGAMGVMGIPGKTLGGMPGVSFFGVQAHAKRVMFLIDHAGHMVGRLYLIRREVRASIQNLLPFQKFAVITISGKYKILGPAKLLRASPANKAAVRKKVSTVIAEGHDQGLLLPFLRPFKAAWAMKPQVIFFLTDGYVDPRLIGDIRRMHEQYPIRVYTFTLIGTTRIHQEYLRRIAAETGGKFLYLSKRVLLRQHPASQR
jgi:hypothetical protein